MALVNESIAAHKLTGQLFAITIIRSPWIVASFSDATMFASKYQSIWTIVQFRLIIYAFPVSVTVGGIADNSCFRFARIFLVSFLGMGDSCAQKKIPTKRIAKK